MGNCACDVTTDQLDQPITPSHFFLELTPTCNNACPGCSNTFANDRSRKPLLADEWGQVLAQIAPYKPRLRLTGGEPTLHPEFEQIVERVVDLGLAFTLFTNARWKDPGRLLAFLADVPQLEGLLISLHGADAFAHDAFTATPGAFAETVGNIRRATQKGIRVVTSTVITRQNYRQVNDIVNLSRELGADRAVFDRYVGAPLVGLEPDEAELRLAIESIESADDDRRKCGDYSSDGQARIRYGVPIPQCFIANKSHACLAGTAHAAIDPWGNLHPCVHTTLSAGNLLTTEFASVWQSPILKQWREMIPSSCANCASFVQCQGGCRAMQLVRGSGFDPLVHLSN